MRSTRVVVVSVLALVLVLPGRAVAHATESEWMLDGSTLTELEKSEASVSLVSKPVTLTVPSKSLTIECKKDEGSGKIFKGGTQELKATLTGCTVAKSEACKVESLVLNVKTKMISAGDVYYEKIEAAKEGSPITTVVIKGEKCTQPKETAVKGSFAAEISMEELAEPPMKFSEKLSETVNKELKAEGESELSLSFGESAAHFVGEFVPPPILPPRQEEPLPFTRLCDTKGATCAGLHIYPANTPFVALSQVTINFRMGTSPVIETNCSTSGFEAETTAISGAPLPATTSGEGWDFVPCSEDKCTVTSLGMPYALKFFALNYGDGVILVKEPSFKIVCGGKTCVYGLSRMRLVVGGGKGGTEPAQLVLPPTALEPKAGSDAACVNNGNVEQAPPTGGAAFYKVVDPTGALFFTG
jgi:hypothetical protein